MSFTVTLTPTDAAIPSELVNVIKGDPAGGGGGGTTNLAYTASPTGGTVTSDTGTDATLTLADATNAGLMAPAQHSKLANLPSSADAAGTAASAVAAHVAAADPHPGYRLESDTTDAITEGSTNLFHTAARVRAAVLTGLSTATNAVIDAADTVLGALGKLQAQITANLATLTGHTSNTGNPHSVTAAQVGAATSGAVTGSGLTMATDRLLGRSTASTGAVEEISVGSGLSLSGGTLSASGGGGLPGGSGTELQYRSGASSFGAVTGSSVDGASITLGGETVTASKPVLTTTQTWNNAAVTFIGRTINITDTASAAASILDRWQVGGVTMASLSKTGALTLRGSGDSWVLDGNLATGYFAIGRPSNVAAAFNWSDQFVLSASHSLVWSASGNALQAVDVGIKRTAGVLEVNSGTAGTYRDLRLRNLLATGSLATGVTTKTAAYTATVNDHTILCDATSGAITITGYACSGNAGRRLTVKKTDSSGNAVTFDPNASETVDGASTRATSTQNGGFTVQVNDAGTAWVVVATF